MDQFYADHKARRKKQEEKDDKQEEKETDKKQEQEDVSFLSSNLLPIFNVFEEEIDESILSLNEIETETSSPNKVKENNRTASKEEYTLLATLIMQNKSIYAPPHMRKVYKDDKEHHQDAQHKKEEDSQDPNFDRDNPNKNKRYGSKEERTASNNPTSLSSPSSPLSIAHLLSISLNDRKEEEN